MDFFDFNKRLLDFSDHLMEIPNHPEEGLYDNVTLINLDTRVSHDMVYHPWVFDELVSAFPHEWKFCEDYGVPYCNEPPTKSPITDVLDYFGLSQEEFQHLFDLTGSQLTGIYGGKVLSLDSKAPDIARNITDFVFNRLCGYRPNQTKH